jgi:uncharacterized membrane protein YhhN
MVKAFGAPSLQRYASPNMKNYPGIYIIASYFLINGVHGFYQIIPFIIKGNSISAIYSPLIFNTGFLVAGIGLILRKGWGRNFTLFFNGIYIILGLQQLLIYFYGDVPDTRPIAKGIVNFLIAGLIYFYLFKTKIKALFDESPVSWCILGMVLLFYSQNQRVGNMIIDTFWAVMMIVSFVLFGLGAKQLRKNIA